MGAINVLLDHQIFSTYVYGGISRYFCELIKHLNGNTAITINLPSIYSNNNYLREIPGINYKPFIENIRFRGKAHLLNILNRRISRTSLKKQSFDIFHPTYYDPYFLNHIADKPFVLTIHDMIHELYAGHFLPQDNTAKWKRLLIKKASKIITVSENTKRDVVRYYGLDESKIEVIYLANSLYYDATVEFNNKIRLPDRYILYVGDRKGYKNFDTFIRAASQILLRDKGLHIVCAGGCKFSVEELELFTKLRISGRVYHYSMIGDQLLAHLYHKASAFIYPSLYEGFGLPVLESFACGCPAIVSNSSSLPEVAADAAVYFDPQDSLSIETSISNVLYDKKLVQKLRNMGFERLKCFSWDKTAKKTQSIYMGLL